MHYTSNIKPWFERKRPGAEKFWNFAKRTPFYKELLEAERLGMTESQKKLSESKVSKSTNADVLEMMRILRSIVQKSEIFTKIPMSSIDEKFSSKDYKIRLFFYALKHGDVYAAEHVIQEMYNFQNKNIIDEYEKRIKKIYSSPSMVITRPLRWIIKIFKG